MKKVSVSFKNQTKSTVADQNGNWKVDLDQEKEGGPFTLTIKGNNEIIFKNVWWEMFGYVVDKAIWSGRFRLLKVIKKSLIKKNFRSLDILKLKKKNKFFTSK